MDRTFDDLSRQLGHPFTRAGLLREALTHPSASNSRKGDGRTYERLEFLGDRVLGLIVADMLLAAFPDEKEGALARRHAALVRREALARIAESIGLGRFLVLSKGEEEGGGRSNQAILADACEAVIGALYLDGGLSVCSEFVRRHWEPLMSETRRPPKDAKTALQEWAQGLGKPLPIYELKEAKGPPHDLHFLVEVRVDGKEAASGQGSTKRAAEQAAAGALMEKVAK